VVLSVLLHRSFCVALEVQLFSAKQRSETYARPLVEGCTTRFTIVSSVTRSVKRSVPRSSSSWQAVAAASRTRFDPTGIPELA
jgi:hypothetical protein